MDNRIKILAQELHSKSLDELSEIVHVVYTKNYLHSISENSLWELLTLEALLEEDDLFSIDELSAVVTIYKNLHNEEHFKIYKE